MLGQILGHYRILEKIGEGGMGVVYRAHDERLNRDVALKVLPAGSLADESARRRFRKEALALAKLNHPNIESVFDYDSHGQRDFVVMEFIPGITLSEALAAGPLPEREVVALGSQLADGLAAAHERGIIHRDMKPANLRLTPDNRLKILDFGLAKLLRGNEADLTQSATEQGGIAGTLPYMAPEQLRGEPVDERTDIYAAGAVLYELIAGRRPFEKRTAALITDIQQTPPPPLSGTQPEVSPLLNALILKCLEKDPGRRYQSAKELAVDLRRLAMPAYAPQAPALPRRRKRTGLAVLAATAGALALLALLLVLNIAGIRERIWSNASGAAVRSLAVLPLEDLSHAPEQEYFADGMTEALITDLSKIGALRVISRTSVMQYKNKSKTLPQIARELGVDAVVEGSVLRVGDRVRITAQLIQASPERHLWANSYDREMRDVLAVHSEVARAVADEIRIQLTPEDRARLEIRRRVDPAAHELYLKARHLLSRGGRFQATEAYLKEAIARDPTYAPSYCALAELHIFSLPTREHMPAARSAAARALELDDTQEEAHAALGLVRLFYDWDWAGVEPEFRRAIELNPGSALVHHRYAMYLWAMARVAEAIAENKRARDLDPLSTLINLDYGRSFFFARRYNEAIEQYRKTLEFDPNSTLAHLFLGLAYEQQGRFDDAVREIARSRELMSYKDFADAILRGYAASGYHGALRVWAETWERGAPDRAQPSSIAMIYARLGEKDKAMEWLERGFEERTRAMVFINVEPQLDGIRSDPRFKDLQRRMGLVPADSK